MADLSKKFVSEAEVEEQKKKRQEEWEKVRRPDQPEEAPEEAYDPRSLYERLQEQKNKKDEEFEEAHKLKNQIRGLDEEETDFLDYVSDRQRDLQKAKIAEDEEVLNEYRNSVVSKAEVPKEPVKPSAKNPEKKPVLAAKKSSQQKLLAGAVKRKSRSESNEEADAKKPKTSDAAATTEGTAASSGLADRGQCKVVGVLPGLGSYIASSDETSDSASDSDDLEVVPLMPKKITAQCQNG